LAVLVVGGAGYIGSHAAHVLRRKGYEVIIYDNLSAGHKQLAEGFELVVGDIGDSQKLSSLLRLGRRKRSIRLMRFWKSSGFS